MKKRRKTGKCLNCGFGLDPSFDYCPKCGQENTDHQLSLGKLIVDFFSNYFSLDSRFGRSFKPFFFKPGILTREFMEGHRVKYANPIRLYLVISLIHFFVLSIYSGNDNESGGSIITETDSAATPQKNNVITFNQNGESKDGTWVTASDSTSEGAFSSITNENLQLIKNMVSDHSVDQIMDSLNVAERPYYERVMLRQITKIEKQGNTSLKAYILQNIPILMFFLLPIYALILKLFFRKRLYINHVVHSLHLHSFLFIVLTLFWLYALFQEPPAIVGGIAFLLPTIYIIASFRNTYHVSKTRATFKTFLSGLAYFIVLTLASVITILISFLTF